MNAEDTEELEQFFAKVGDRLETAAADLKSGNVETASYELQNVAWQMQEFEFDG